jgi:hypothetical protein
MALTQRTAEGESCREWTVDNAYTVCLSLNDHLPQDFKARDGKRLRQIHRLEPENRHRTTRTLNSSFPCPSAQHF